MPLESVATLACSADIHWFDTSAFCPEPVPVVEDGAGVWAISSGPSTGLLRAAAQGRPAAGARQAHWVVIGGADGPDATAAIARMQASAANARASTSATDWNKAVGALVRLGWLKGSEYPRHR
jgi:hypothetical protein